MHTPLLGMLAEELWQYSKMGKLKLNACSATTGHIRWCLAVQKHVGLTVFVAGTYVVESDPGMLARSWIT